MEFAVEIVVLLFVVFKVLFGVIDGVTGVGGEGGLGGVKIAMANLTPNSIISIRFADYEEDDESVL